MEQIRGCHVRMLFLFQDEAVVRRAVGAGTTPCCTADGPSGLTSIGLRNSAVGWLFADLVLHMAGPVKPSTISCAVHRRGRADGKSIMSHKKKGTTRLRKERI